MIRRCVQSDFQRIYEIINESAQIYKGVIPSDRWKDPYMTKEELSHEIRDGVEFWCYEAIGNTIGVMGVQKVEDVTLIRHAYVIPEMMYQGVGSTLLDFLLKRSEPPILAGTWADAQWAIKFYEKHGFKTVTKNEKDKLLKEYWSISDRQIELSVVLKSKS
jgi:N-acetylglutamate synthase-like GNAT family acetyltransferase